MLVVKFRSDNSANWENANPVLRAGELAVDTEKTLYKIGDGKTSWKDLPFMGMPNTLNEFCIYLPGATQPTIKFEIPKREENKNDFGWIAEPEDFRI